MSTTEFVRIGNTFASRERAEQKKQRLIERGFTLVSSTSKLLTFKLQ